jgi:hypothetical protein
MNKGTIDAVQSNQIQEANTSIKINAQNSSISAFNADFSLKVCSNDCKNKDNIDINDGIYGKVISGTAVTENQKGKSEVKKGENFYIKDSNSSIEKEKSSSKLFSKNQVRSSQSTNSSTTDSDITSRIEGNKIINNVFYFSEAEQLNTNGTSKLSCADDTCR